MKRIDGYIDLDDLLKLEIPQMPRFERYEELKERMKDVKNFKVIKEETRYHYDNPLFVLSYEFEGKIYFFKQDLETIPYYELIASEIANEMGIDCVQYDLAKLGKYYGTISSNYKIKNAKYISGEELLKSVFKKDKYRELYYGKNNKEAKNTMYHNNIMDIWHALEVRYRDRENVQDIAKNITNKLVKLQIFDFITGQNDRHDQNWGIVEYQNGLVDLQPIFDNSRMFLSEPYKQRLWLSPDNTNFYLEDAFKYLYSVSDKEIQNFILGSLYIINENNIKNIINKVELKIEDSIPHNIKESILFHFREQYDFLLKTITDYNLLNSARK